MRAAAKTPAMKGRALIKQQEIRLHLQDLLPALLVRETDFDVYLQATGTKQGLVEHVLSVGHPDQKNVVQGLDAVNLGEHLVYWWSERALGAAQFPKLVEQTKKN
jgi:hypothetical protein